MTTKWELQCHKCFETTHNVEKDAEECPECGSTDTTVQTRELDQEKDTLNV